MNTEAYIGKFEELRSYSEYDQAVILELARYESFQVMGNAKRLIVFCILGLLGVFLLSTLPALLLGLNYLGVAACTGIGIAVFVYSYNVRSTRLLRLGIPAAVSRFTSGN